MSRSFSRLIFVVATLSALLLSCSKEPQGDVRLRKDLVGVSSGEVFLSVTSTASWSLEVEYIGDQKDWITFSRTTGSGTVNSIIVFYTANRSDDSRSAYIRARLNDGVVQTKLTQKGLSSIKEGGPGTVLPSWPGFPGLKSEVMPGWMELPAVYEIEGCAWVHHDMALPQYTGRNYSIFYDAANLMPRWVAYPLNPSLYGSGSRSNNWKQWDPKIPEDFQPTTQEGGWRVDGYDRGHMVPSADRVATDESNWQTFYPTNMVVKKGQKLNQRIWGNLESQVRLWSQSCDTLYVVTGAIPSKEFITDRGGKQVNKPEAFYKVLLQYKKNVSEPETYAGIAFYLENRDYDEDVVNSSMTMSVQSLERKLGINFFVNLPDEYVVHAEEKCDLKYWGIK